MLQYLRRLHAGLAAEIATTASVGPMDAAPPGLDDSTRPGVAAVVFRSATPAWLVSHRRYRQVEGYCLNPEHPRGKHKARVFASALGLTTAHAEMLRSALLEAAASVDVRPTITDQFGERYVLEFHMRGPKGAAVVVSTWIVLGGEEQPRLTTCFVK